MAGALAALAAGSAVRLLLLRRVEDAALARSRRESLKSWWVVALAVGAAALLGRPGAVLLLAAVSVAGFGEFVRLAVGGASWRTLQLEGSLLIALHYLLVWLELGWGFTAFLPVAGTVWISLRLAVTDDEAGFRDVAGDVAWGLLLAGYGLSHAVFFYGTASASNPVAGPVGWFLFLVLLAQSNDIFQALVGRSFGARRLAPELSPQKTWEGFLGGLATTVLLALALAPLLTPLGHGRAALAGLLIAPAGLAGDLTVSALKRRAGVKDSGRALPGQGGVLDRADSLLLSAPVFFYFAVLFG